MDIICRVCGEPWEHDCLHDVAGADFAKAEGMTYKEYMAIEPDSRVREAKYSPFYKNVLHAFQSEGCKALESEYGPQNHCVPKESKRTAAASAMYDLLGDDMDGAASMLADLDYLGELD